MQKTVCLSLKNAINQYREPFVLAAARIGIGERILRCGMPVLLGIVPHSSTSFLHFASTEGSPKSSSFQPSYSIVFDVRFFIPARALTKGRCGLAQCMKGCKLLG